MASALALPQLPLRDLSQHDVRSGARP